MQFPHGHDNMSDTQESNTAAGRDIYDLRQAVEALSSNTLKVVDPGMDLTTAIADASSGDTLEPLPGTHSGSLTEAIEVADGIAIVGRSPETTVIAMPSGTPTVPTIRYRGNNYTEGISIESQASGSGTEGGINLCGSNHVFRNCIITGNQDTMTLGIASASADADKWGGGTRFEDCRFTDWNFDFIRPNAAAITSGQQDIKFYNCYIATSTLNAERFLRNNSPFGYRVELHNCEIDARKTGYPSWTMYSGTDGSAYKGKTAVTGADAAMTSASNYSEVTQVAAFASYVLREGDLFRVASGGTVGTYNVIARIDDDTIRVAGLVNGTDITDDSLVGNIEPGYEFIMRGGVIRTGSKCTTTNLALFRVYGSLNGAGVGIKITLDNVRIEAPSGLNLCVGSAGGHASPSPQPSATFNNCQIPAGFTKTNCNGANQPKVILRGSSLLESTWTISDGATITADPNLGAKQLCTAIAGDRTLAINANGGDFYTGQEVEIILASDGTGRTVTPDGSTVKGEAISVHATSTIRVTSRYVYTGSYWVQAGMPQETGY